MVETPSFIPYLATLAEPPPPPIPTNKDWLNEFNIVLVHLNLIYCIHSSLSKKTDVVTGTGFKIECIDSANVSTAICCNNCLDEVETVMADWKETGLNTT